MSEKTVNYQLTKLDSAEIGSMIDLNSNVDKVDAALKQNQDAQQRHSADQNNPHNVTKEQVGLGNADNTADKDKPVSMAQQTVLDGKADANHNHSAADITAGILPIAWGGTGQTSLTGVKDSLGITDLEKKLAENHITDEYDTSDGWHVRKYKNGRCEASIEKEITGAFTNAIGGAYLNSYDFNFPENLFLSRPKVWTNTCSNAAIWSCASSGTTKDRIYFYDLKPTSGSLVYSIFALAEGMWK